MYSKNKKWKPCDIDLQAGGGVKTSHFFGLQILTDYTPDEIQPREKKKDSLVAKNKKKLRKTPGAIHDLVESNGVKNKPDLKKREEKKSIEPNRNISSKHKLQISADEGATQQDSNVKEICEPKSKKRKKNKVPRKLLQEVDATPKCSAEQINIAAWQACHVPEPIIQALQDLGYVNPTEIQARVLPAAIRDRDDILGAAETGSGKTLAFGIPILARILEERDAVEREGNVWERGLRALVLTPTRELAIQVRTHIARVARYCDVMVEPVIGGMSRERQIRIFSKKPEIIVGTPGRLWEFVDLGQDYFADIKNIRCLVVDEADRMAEQNHYEDLQKLLDLINSRDLFHRLERYKPLPSMEDADLFEEARKQRLQRRRPKSDFCSEDGKEADEDLDSEEEELRRGDTLTHRDFDEHDAAADSDESDDDDDQQTKKKKKTKKSVKNNGTNAEADDEDQDSDDDVNDDEDSDDDDSDAELLNQKTRRALKNQKKSSANDDAVKVDIDYDDDYKKKHVLAAGKGKFKVKNMDNDDDDDKEDVDATAGANGKKAGEKRKLNGHERFPRGQVFTVNNFIDEPSTSENKMEGKGSGRGGRQTFVFSATLTLVHAPPQRKLVQQKRMEKLSSDQKLGKLINMIGIREKHKVFDITRKIGTAETLRESRIFCFKMEEKDALLYYIYTLHHARTLVFCNSVDSVRRLRSVMQVLGCNPLPLFAAMQQRQRLKNLERFYENPRGLLLATDVAARGLDIPGVEQVVHFQVPRTAETYIHRSGRTARAKNAGVSVMLIDTSEIKTYKNICRTLNREQDLEEFPVDDRLMKGIKERVGVAREIDVIEHRLKKENVNENWLQRTAREMDIELDREYDSDEEERQKREKAALKRKANILRKELAAQLAQPVRPVGFTGKYPTITGELVLPIPQTSNVNKNKAFKLLAAKRKSDSAEKPAPDVEETPLPEVRRIAPEVVRREGARLKRQIRISAIRKKYGNQKSKSSFGSGRKSTPGKKKGRKS